VRSKNADPPVASERRVVRLPDLAGEIWGAMVHAVLARRDHMTMIAAKFELTLPQAHLLRLLQYGPARTMTSIADALACDASNITGIVDRLEARGLIARGNTKHDRRIKTISLTARGRAVLGELREGFLEPPEGLRKLTDQQLCSFHKFIIRSLGRWQDDVKCADSSPPPGIAKPT
jgi:DNA-binding MarR family transcriptional regulator